MRDTRVRDLDQSRRGTRRSNVDSEVLQIQGLDLNTTLDGTGKMGRKQGSEGSLRETSVHIVKDQGNE